MAGQMAKQVAADVAGDADKCEAGDPAGQPPQQIVGGNQRHQEEKRAPHASRCVGAREHVDQILHAVLRADRANYGGQHRVTMTAGMHGRMPDVTKYEGEWPVSVTIWLLHRALDLDFLDFNRCLVAANFVQARFAGRPLRCRVSDQLIVERPALLDCTWKNSTRPAESSKTFEKEFSRGANSWAFRFNSVGLGAFPCTRTHGSI